MNQNRTYLDYNATAPVWPEVVDIVAETLRAGGNASSVHREGRAAREIIEKSREDVARLAGASPGEVVFTSGGSEANNQAINGVVGARSAESLIISGIEHPSILDTAEHSGADVHRLRVDGSGVVVVEDLVACLEASPANALVSIMLANNETGAIQPIKDIAEIVHAHGALLHVDAIQAASKIPVEFNALGADLMTLSSHKIGGPHGVGALIVRDGLAIDPIVRGGGQELGRRAGTENLAGIAGFGAAAVIAGRKLDAMAGHARMRDNFESALRTRAKDAIVFSHDGSRLPNTSCFSAPGLNAETMVIALDLAGFSVSSGSACSSGKVARSHVLDAMGVDDDLARGAIRMSFGWKTQPDDLERFLDQWMKIYERSAERRNGIAA